ncbi:hypothetical protein IWQ48_003247 [Labrenzia sp. EL_13]|nr:hypothetical protein [Labrenzia sp. EL_13]
MVVKANSGSGLTNDQNWIAVRFSLNSGLNSKSVTEKKIIGNFLWKPTFFPADFVRLR